MLAEAIGKIEEMAQPQTETVDGHRYIITKDGFAHEILPDLHEPECKTLTSLDALVQMIKTEALTGIMPLHAHPVYVEIVSHDKVEVFLTASCSDDGRYQRPSIYTAKAVDVPGWAPSVQMGYEEAIVALQTRFQDNTGRADTLRLLSQITTGASITYNDNGIATTVTTKKGVALCENTTFKPLVSLRPYRTFQEVEQPESLFLFRLDDKGHVVFTEADGGMWKLAARNTVKDWLERELSSEIDAGDVVVML